MYKSDNTTGELDRKTAGEALTVYNLSKTEKNRENYLDNVDHAMRILQ